MFFVKHVLGTLLFALPILRSVSTSSGHVERSSDTTVASKCSDQRPKWCNKMRIEFPDTLARKCKTDNSKVQVKFCCETCKVLNSVTTDVAPTTVDVVSPQKIVTTEKVVAKKATTQYLMYNVMDTETIYSYILDVDSDPVQNEICDNLKYDISLSSLEIVGALYDSSNKNHKIMSIAGSFSDVPGSLFNGDNLFEVCFSRNVGTLVFSGYHHMDGKPYGSTQVYIITQNSNWNIIGSADKYLSSFQNPILRDYLTSSGTYSSFGVAEQDDTIYLIGGWAAHDVRSDIRVLNVKDVNSLEEAKTRQWKLMGNLKHSVSRPVLIYSNDKLLVVGQTGNPDTCKDVQYLNLASNTVGVYADTIDCGHHNDGYINPGIYSVGEGNVSIFGGNGATGSCMQQTMSDTPESRWKCMSISESALEGLEYYGWKGVGWNIRFSNFVI